MQHTWIAVDWGTTSLRAWRMEGDAPTDQKSSDKGMGTLAPDAFEPALLDLISPWLSDQPTDVIACGMVGARQGWIEAPYASAPCKPAHTTIKAPTTDPRLNVSIIAGISQAKPADVMRGEETQIAGFLSLNPDFDGVLCLPGTHTKWAQISAGEIVSFATYMTGELFALLSQNSVLRHSVTADGMDEPAFLDATADAISNPQRIAARLFSLRAESLLTNQSAEVARAKLSGALIGIELAASRPYWLGQNIALIGAQSTSDLYAKALGAQGAQAKIEDVETMTLAGLTAAYRKAKS